MVIKNMVGYFGIFPPVGDKVSIFVVSGASIYLEIWSYITRQGRDDPTAVITFILFIDPRQTTFQPNPSFAFFISIRRTPRPPTCI